MLGRILFCALAVWLFWSRATAHEDINLQVAALTCRIAERPENAALYVQRGELHRIHRDWLPALTDYLRASQLDPGLQVVNLCLSDLLVGVEHPGLALAALDRFLASHPDHPGARLRRGRALLSVGLRLEAARELTRAIDLHGSSRPPRPDVYLDRARALAAEGGEHVDEAIHGLDEGARRLGGAITLQLLAIDIEVRERRWDAALERLAAIEASSPRKESWLAHRGEVLLAAGRTDDARRVFQDALAAIAALPQHRRVAPVMAALDARVHAALSSPCLAGDSQHNERK